MSELEELFAFQVRVTGLPAPCREYRFDPVRRWRLDFAWPERMIAVEIDGGTWVNGRHNRAAGFKADCLKYNAAVLNGWRVLRFTADAIDDGSALDQVEQALAVGPPAC